MVEKTSDESTLNLPSIFANYFNSLTGKNQAGSALLKKLPVQAASSLLSSLFFPVLFLALETHMYIFI